MSIIRRTSLLSTAAMMLCHSVACGTATAGPLLDWLNDQRWKDSKPLPYAVTPAVGVVPATTQVSQFPLAPPTYNVPAANNYSAGYGVAIPQTAVGVLPTGSYQTALNNVPTTYYRPVTTIDPATGTPVTTLQPCSSYQQQTLRLPLLNPATYYAAYGNYGAGLQQDRYSSVTGSGVAAATSQSGLSIPSGVNTTALSPVNQFPSNGYAVSPTPLIAPAAAYQPTFNNQPMISNQAIVANQAVTPLTNYSGYDAQARTLPTLPYANAQPMTSSAYSTPNYAAPVTANYQSYSNPQNIAPAATLPANNAQRFVQPDGTIITPLGPPTISTAPIASTTAPSSNTLPPSNTSYFGSTNIPQTNHSSSPSTSQAYGVPQRQPDGSIVTALPPNYSASSNSSADLNQFNGSAYRPMQAPIAQPPLSNSADARFSPVFPNGAYDPTNSSGSQPSPSQQDVLPPAPVYPNSSSTNPALGDPESLRAPALTTPPAGYTPLSSNSPFSSTDERMVQIDRPRGQFTRKPLNETLSAQPITAPEFNPALNYAPAPANNQQYVRTPMSGQASQSIQAPALLPKSEEMDLQNAMRPPAGYDSKPYWRSEQKSASPSALLDSSEKTAGKSDVHFANSTTTIDHPQSSQVASATFIDFVREAQPVAASDASRISLQPNTAKNNLPLAAGAVPVLRSHGAPRKLFADDGFLPASK